MALSVREQDEAWHIVGVLAGEKAVDDSCDDSFI